MALFQKTVLKKHLLEANTPEVDAAYKRFSAYFHDATRQQNIRNSKEEQFQEGFLRELFGHIFGYTLNPEPNFNLTTELKNTSNSKKVDGAIVFDGKAIAVIELKGTNTTDLNSIETQAFGYKNNQSECVYVITSNFEKLRFYIDNSIDYEEFNLFTLNREQFNLLYLCLNLQSIQQHLPKRLKDESVSQEDAITKKLYKDYSEFKRALYQNLVELNPEFDKLLLFKKTQKLLDRFLFIFFAEDRLLLPTNLIFRINQEWKNLMKMRMTVSLYDRYKVYFNDLNVGAKVTLPAFGKKTGDAIEAEFEIFAYNGGLFVPDEVLDNVKIDDEVLHVYTEKMSHYDFDSDVDVNILGHIFENSLNEIDEIKSEIEGEAVDKTKTRRKKDGVFYTPKYITKYIVDNTVGKLCTEKKAELKLVDEDYTNDKKIQTKTKKAHLDKLTDYRTWLLQLTICDPACGSGAFLNQALEFLIAEHRYVDELQAKLMGDSLILSDVENSILENNIYGVDLNDESVEIAKLSLWLRTAQKGRKLNSLNNNIKCGNSLIDDPEVAGDKAFSWEKEFPEVFAKGGFDVVIGNPPYVRQELFKEIKPYLEKHYECYNSIADLYTYFIEKGIDLMNSKGLFSFILPNKFLKSAYGKEIRLVLKKKGNLELLYDFDDYPVFAEATTYPIIFVLNKNLNYQKDYLLYSEINNRISSNNPIDELDIKKVKVSFESLTDEIWNFINLDEMALNKKLFNDSKPLSDIVKKKIYRGLTTGKNEAFVIDEFKKDELINLNLKNQEIIKRLATGKEVKRNSFNFQYKYLVFTGYDKNIPEEYPEIQIHLDNYKEELIKRYDQGLNYWNLRACAYYEEMAQPKIIYPRINNQGNFYLDSKGDIFLLDNNFFISSNSKGLLALLNSKLIFYFLKSICTTLQGGFYDFRRDKITTIPVKNNFSKYENDLSVLGEKLIGLTDSLNTEIKKFPAYINSQYQLEKLSGKLTNWYDLDFPDFIKELNKAIKTAKGSPLTKKDEFEWMELFEENKKKALALKAEIDRTDKEIDQMVYELYGLTEEEIKIVEGE